MKSTSGKVRLLMKQGGFFKMELNHNHYLLQT